MRWGEESGSERERERERVVDHAPPRVIDRHPSPGERTSGAYILISPRRWSGLGGYKTAATSAGGGRAESVLACKNFAKITWTRRLRTYMRASERSFGLARKL
jgi:hypothetical protein